MGKIIFSIIIICALISCSKGQGKAVATDDGVVAVEPNDSVVVVDENQINLNEANTFVQSMMSDLIKSYNSYAKNGAVSNISSVNKSVYNYLDSGLKLAYNKLVKFDELVKDWEEYEEIPNASASTERGPGISPEEILPDQMEIDYHSIADYILHMGDNEFSFWDERCIVYDWKIEGIDLMDSENAIAKVLLHKESFYENHPRHSYVTTLELKKENGEWKLYNCNGYRKFKAKLQNCGL